MKTLHQMAAVIRIKFSFGLRRGWPVVGTATIGLITSIVTFYAAHHNMAGASRKDALVEGTQALAMAWPVSSHSDVAVSLSLATAVLIIIALLARGWLYGRENF